jgi:hypothetical protein
MWAAACLVAAFGILVFEGFVWMRFGNWPAYSVMDLITLLGLRGSIPWARVPGLHRTLASVPLPAVFLVAALLLSWKPSGRR